jgi:hypothetical protein
VLLDRPLQSVWIDANHRQQTFTTPVLGRGQGCPRRDRRISAIGSADYAE